MDACARMCPADQPFCAVRDPVALDAVGADNRRFAEQDTLNEYFSAWHKLPKHCNWLNYLENHKSAKTDPTVRMVHSV